MFWGAVHMLPSFFTIQMSVSLPVFPGVGLLEIKKRVLPSGEMQGLKSLYLPEKGAIRGSVHLPLRYVDRQITIVLLCRVEGVRFVK